MREAGVPSHTLAAELLLMYTLGRERTWLYTHPEALLEPAAAEKYLALVARRMAGEPTQYLTGKQEFWGLEFEVNPSVLIPRPETEHVVEVALERIAQMKPRGSIRIADACTGSGCLAVALAHELPEAEMWATDISPHALEVARRNATRHSADSRIRFIECNLLDGVLCDSPPSPVGASDQINAITRRESRQFDLVVSNPPYVGRSEVAQLPREIREHEPAQALFGGESGIEIYAPLIQQAGRLLRAGGIVVLELGYDSLEYVGNLLDPARDWIRVSVTPDLAGIPRVISAERA